MKMYKILKFFWRRPKNAARLTLIAIIGIIGVAVALNIVPFFAKAIFYLIAILGIIGGFLYLRHRLRV